MPVIVTTPADLEQAGKVAKRPTWTSLRYHTGDMNAGTGFSYSLITLDGPFELQLQYKNHVESNLVLEGEFIVTDVDAQKTYTLGAGCAYTCANGERHRVQVKAGKSAKLVSVFNPPLEGTETHDADGSYPPPRLGLRYSGRSVAPWFAVGVATGVALMLGARRIRA